MPSSVIFEERTRRTLHMKKYVMVYTKQTSQHLMRILDSSALRMQYDRGSSLSWLYRIESQKTIRSTVTIYANIEHQNWPIYEIDGHWVTKFCYDREHKSLSKKRRCVKQ